MKLLTVINEQLSMFHTFMVQMCHLYMEIKSNPERAKEATELKSKIIELNSEIFRLDRMKKTVFTFHNHAKGDDRAWFQ